MYISARFELICLLIPKISGLFILGNGVRQPLGGIDDVFLICPPLAVEMITLTLQNPTHSVNLYALSSMWLL